MFLIVSQHHDVHATAVCWALEQAGVQVEIFDLYSAVAGGSVSLDIDQGWLRWTCPRDAREKIVLLDEIRGIWMRRGSRNFDLSRVNPLDREIVQRELISTARAIEAVLLSMSPVCFNPTGVLGHGDQKTIQLQAASREGLSTPRTLISNHIDHVRAFCGEENRIAKPFNQNAWSEEDKVEGGMHIQHAALVTQCDLVDPMPVQLCPTIYQDRIDKSHELRITIFDQRIIAARLDSQSVAEAEVDWRSDFLQKVPVEGPVALPSHVEAAIGRLMRRLNLRFGCMDMIVDRSGQHVFLEVNQQGQFLWLESREPTLGLLGAFVDMVCRATGVVANQADLRLETYYGSDRCKGDLALRATYYAQGAT